MSSPSFSASNSGSTLASGFPDQVSSKLSDNPTGSYYCAETILKDRNEPKRAEYLAELFAEHNHKMSQKDYRTGQVFWAEFNLPTGQFYLMVIHCGPANDVHIDDIYLFGEATLPLLKRCLYGTKTGFEPILTIRQDFDTMAWITITVE
jgi:hypothetical protein